MINTEIYKKIETIDSLKQEKLFLEQKYRNWRFSLNDLEDKSLDIDLSKSTKQTSNSIKGDPKAIKNITLFAIFLMLGNNETKFKNFLSQEYLKNNLFDYKGNLENASFFVEKKLTSKLKEIGLQTQLNNELILKDVLRYYELDAQIKSKENEKTIISGEQISYKKIVDYYTQNITSIIKQEKEKEKKNLDILFDGEIDQELVNLLGLEEKNLKIDNEELKNLAWKYNFFKLVQKSVEKGYVFSYREMELIEDILKDLKNGKVVLLTGDTGSGKTELARFICSNFLKTDYVFISGSKESEVSDFTLEKVITSKSHLTTKADIIENEVTKSDNFLSQQAENTLNDLITTKEFKELVIEKATEQGKSKDEITELETELNQMELTKKSLITEYHLMGIYKAANLGIPCIIDETNIIRPEVFMALNDLLTRKKGDHIQLSNALGKIEVKDGFCILLTGNDPEQNTKTQRYTSGRYNFDEATYNRFKVYDKPYFTQSKEKFEENKVISNIDTTLEYLNENELYGVILMMMFKSGSNLTFTGKYGFEIMKKNLELENITKEDFFNNIKSFAIGISTVQKAFSGEVITDLPPQFSTKSLKDMITRKVFSMRNLLEVLDSYKQDTLPLDYHIYNEFIKNTTNEDEKYALLIIFSTVGFFGNLVTDSLKNSIKNIEIKMRELKGQKTKISLESIQNKFIVTKSDLYKEYFGSMELSDNFFEGNLETLTEENEIEEDFSSLNSIEFSKEDLLESIELTINLINEFHTYFEIFEIQYFFNLFESLKKELEENKIAHKNYSKISSYLVQINNIIKNFGEGNNNRDIYKKSEQYRKELQKLLT